MPQTYTFSYKPGSNRKETFSFNTEEYKIKYHIATSSKFMCINKSTDVEYENKLRFENNTQKEQFTAALQRKDLDTVRQIARVFEGKIGDDNYFPHLQPVSYFLEGYLAQIKKDKKHNESFFVRHGFFKTHSVQFDVTDMDEEKVLDAVPNKK